MNSVSLKNKTKKQPIGVFDSGVGGLTVARKIKQLMPQENLIYFGDTKHLPYGDKSKKAIIEYSIRITKFLLEQGCKAIVIACNTATANALKEVHKTIDGRALLFDVIHPVATKVAQDQKTSVGLIATKATVRTSLYKKSIEALNPHISVHELATPMLVPAIEEGFIQHQISEVILSHYLSDNNLKDIQTLILGCTHYPLLTQEIEDYYQGKVEIIDSPEIVAEEVKKSLAQHQLLNSDNPTPQYEFYLSDLTDNFKKIATAFFGNELKLSLKNLDHE